MKTGVIYKHINKTNNKVYIGSTTQNPKRRWRKSNNSFKSYNQCPAFYNALKLHGWDSFESSIIEDNIPVNQLKEKEEFYIKQYNSLAPNGYNTTNIVDGSFIKSLETRQKISDKAKNYEKREPSNKNKHVLVDNIPHKKCPKCEELKLLSEYNRSSQSWDRLMRICRDCQKKHQLTYKSPNKKTLSKEELELSYKNRQTKDKPIRGVHVMTSEALEFKSGSEAVKHGFDKTSIRRNILKNRPYKNYLWSYVDNSPQKIRASDCVIQEVFVNEEREFLDLNHKQKYIASSWSYGLFYNKELVCILTMGKPRFNKNYQWEILRLCTKKNTFVHGGASRLFKFFVKDKNPANVLTYATIGFSTGGKVYEKLGFTFLRSSQPSYVYKKDDIVISRTQAQKKRLFKLLGEQYSSLKSEVRNMLDAGYEKITIPGSNVYEWKVT